MINSAKKLMGGLAVATFLLGSAVVSQATLLDGVLLPGSLNTLEDTSREAYIDANNDGVFSAGDVITGYVRVEDVLKQPPGSTTSTGTTTYVVFSQQVSAINNTTGVVDFVATTVNGLQLNQLVSPTSGPIASNAIVAVVTLAGGLGDLITTAPTDLTGNGTITLADYFAQLSTGQLEFSAGITNLNPLGDFFQAQIVAGALASTQLPPAVQGCSGTLPLETECINNLPSSITLANFLAGLSIIDNNTSFTFADDINTAGFTTATTAQVSITGGNATGAFGQGPTGFDDASELGTGNFFQCDNGTTGQGNSPCGFIDNADLSVRPIATPEPASMLLFGFGLLGLGVYGRKRSRKSE